MKKKITVVVNGGVVQEIRMSHVDPDLCISVFDMDNMREEGKSNNQIAKKYLKEIEPLKFGGTF